MNSAVAAAECTSTEFPEGWASVPLVEAVDILDSRRVPINSDERKGRQGQIPYYGATGQVGWIDDFLFDEELLLLGEDGAPFLDKSKPIAYIIRGKSWVNNHAHVLRAKPDMSSNQYLKCFLDSFDFTDYVNGTTRLKLTQGSMQRIPLPLPPLAEQERIVAKLETVLARVNNARERLARVPAILKRFRQSVLAAACSGRLTADWREQHPDVEPARPLLTTIQEHRHARYAEECKRARQEARRPVWAQPETLEDPDADELTEQPDLPDTWGYTRLGNLVEVVRGASPRPAGDPRFFGGDAVPWITVAELTKDERVYLDNVSSFLTEEGRERSRFIPAGTLLLTNSGATLGVPKITRLGGCINDGSVAMVDIPLTSQHYLYYFLKSQTDALRLINQGAAQPNLNTDIVRHIVTPLPPLIEQEQIVTRIEMLLPLLDTIQTRVIQATRRADRLTQSTLARAFRGELVPTEADLARAEGRSYESAAELLERIRRTRKKH